MRLRVRVTDLGVGACLFVCVFDKELGADCAADGFRACRETGVVAAVRDDLDKAGRSSFLGVLVFPPREPRVVRFLPWGNISNGSTLMRPDLRRPFSVNDVGPSAAACLHGGDSCFDFRALGGGVVSRVRSRLAGRSESS